MMVILVTLFAVYLYQYKFVGYDGYYGYCNDFRWLLVVISMRVVVRDTFVG